MVKDRRSLFKKTPSFWWLLLNDHYTYQILLLLLVFVLVMGVGIYCQSSIAYMHTIQGV